MINQKTRINRFLVVIGIALMFFSSACLWNEGSLSKFILCSMIVVCIALIVATIKETSFNAILNNKYIQWVVLIYGIFELYGLFFLRAGQFNWDFILVSGILQISVTIMLCSLDNLDEVINVYCKSCFIAIILVCAYMINKGSIRLSNITFGASYGLELSGNRNTVATSIGIMLIPVVYYALQCATKWQFMYYSVSIVAAGCMLLTGSKKGIIVILLVAIMMYLSFRGGFKYVFFPIAIFLGIYAIFNIPLLYNVVGYRIRDMFASIGIGEAVTHAQSTTIRNRYIIMGLKSMWHHPLFGGGMNYFQFINDAKYYSHNNYVEMLNNFGIIGTAIYYIPAIKCIPLLIAKLKQSHTLNNRKAYSFFIVYVSSKLALDYAMVSYSSMCIFSIQFLLIFEMYRRLLNESETNTSDPSFLGNRWR